MIRSGPLVGLSITALSLGPAPSPADGPSQMAGPVLDMTRAVVLASPDLGGPAAKAPVLLVEEVGKRTLAHWSRVGDWPDEGTPVVLVGTSDRIRRLAEGSALRLPADRGPIGREGYRIGVARRGGAPVVFVEGDDPRGVLFGAGRLLRALRIERRRVTLPADFAAESAPRTPLRGMQLGYRPKTNSYDGWTVAMWKQYLRDLVVFGCNAVELIPPRSDDDADSPHFPAPPSRMLIEMSRLADAYGLDVWLWYPAMDEDYADPRTVAAALDEWGAVFRALPRLDAVFVPGGDPGHTPPKVLFALLEEQAANARKYHPGATMWASPQGFSRDWMDEFLDLLRQGPAWLAGVVYGPQVRMDLPAFRAAVPARYPVRDYPDITHSRHCQYPVPDWDLAFALTEGREASNPRPEQMARIFRRSRPHTAGFIAYSEGCHDDVNKVVWLALGWDERADVREVLREYGRYFVGPEYEGRFADGLIALERDWEGPASVNAGIESTLGLFRAMEARAEPAARRNWRFQHALYRAYYDAYVAARLRDEARREAEARARLRQAPALGAVRAMDEAESILDDATRPPEVVALKSRVCELAEALFQSIAMQLSVAKYRAIAVDRGANLDTIDAPLNDAGWLKARLAAARRLDNEPARLALLASALDRADPGPGGCYDDLGDPRNQPHLVRGAGPVDDPGFFATSLVGFGFRGAGPDPSTLRAWWHHAEALYDAPLVLRYGGLDRSASYRVRVVYARERQAAQVRLVADDRFEVHDDLPRPYEPLEFPIPREATAGGELTLSWRQPPGRGGTGRSCQVAEVWLLKVPEGR